MSSSMVVHGYHPGDLKPSLAFIFHYTTCNPRSKFTDTHQLSLQCSIGACIAKYPRPPACNRKPLDTCLSSALYVATGTKTTLYTCM
jgi:hypothetical protein